MKMTLEITGMPEQDMTQLQVFFQQMVKDFEAAQKTAYPEIKASVVFE